MGWANCGVDTEGRPIGYAFEATCDWPGCEYRIDRGLAYVCGEMHQDGQSCNEYFCEEHRGPPGRHQECGDLCLLCYAYDLMLHWDEPCDDDCGSCAKCAEEKAA